METTDIAWLGGVIDGEGCLSLTTRRRARGYWPVLFIYNSSLPLIEKCDAVIREIGVTPARIKSRPPKNGLSVKNLEGLHVNGGLSTLLRAVLPYLVTEKGEFAAALLQLDAIRVKRTTWTNEQIALAEALRSTYMPRSSQGMRQRGTRGSVTVRSGLGS